MNPSSPGWIALGAVVALAATVLLVRRARMGDQSSRWLAATAVAWGAAFAAQGAGAGAVTPAAIQLTLTDLLALCGLPLLAVGLRQAAKPDSGRSRLGLQHIADGTVLGLAVFCVGWIALLRTSYTATAVGPGTFAVDLIHPVADLVALGGTLGLAVRAGRRALVPYLALCAATLGDLLAVQARAGASHPGTGAQVAWLAAICLLGAAALGRGGGAVVAVPPARRDAPVTAVVAVCAAAVAGLITLIFVAVTWGHASPVPLVSGSVLILALAARIAVLLVVASTTSALAKQAGSQFHQLADRTSDVVLLCDAAGLVSYASQAVSHYGYTPQLLAGARLAELVHPEDLRDALQAAGQVRAGRAVPSASLSCRVRSADGTWRHVQATVSRYSQLGHPDLLLVTVRDVSDQVALRRQVTQLRFHDGLTGLPNRLYLEERTKDLLSRYRAAASPPAASGAIFVDLDGFTAINDSVGHGAGDLVLAQAGRRLRGLVRPHDTVARWAGDEFAVLIDGAASPQEIVEIAERLAGAIAGEPFRVAGRDIAITASVGVAFADPGVEHLLRNADLAMSRAKESGGGRVEVFAAHMHANVIRRLELAADLRAALEGGGLGVEYQPVVELATGRVASVEALVRWSRNGEYVEPAEFLGIAEDSGLIVPLGNRVLGQACQQVGRWRAAGWPVGLSVNLSLRQVSAAGFAGSVLTMLDEHGLSASALTLEVTERVLMEVGDPVMDGLARLRQRGVRLAIDDFGTGYASLAYLRQLPVDIIKIDPSFVAGLGTDGTLAMLTRTIVQIGHDLGIEIVAEGIERPEQLELLRAMGCGLGQGYLVARPMPARGIEALAAETAEAADAERAAGGRPRAGEVAVTDDLASAEVLVKVFTTGRYTGAPDT